MSEIWLPGDSDFARAARGWPSVGKKPTGPVEIDWNHHLSKGLISYVLFRGPGDVQDLVSGRDITYTNTKWKSTGQGIALDLSGSGDYASIDNADGRLCQNTTWCVVTNVDYNGNTADQTIAGVQDKAYWWIATGASSLNFWSGSSVRSDGNAILSAGNYTFGVTADGSNHVWHINGNLDKTLSKSSIPSASTNDVNIGIDPRDQNGLEWESNIYFLAQYTRALSGQEHALYHRNPYALLKPVNQSPFLISVPAAGGTPSLSSPGVINVLSDRATPQVTLTF